MAVNVLNMSCKQIFITAFAFRSFYLSFGLTILSQLTDKCDSYQFIEHTDQMTGGTTEE